ncbi:MAG: hypothetical protein OEY38_04560 [Gammaproteobacteria bacterium]|nr:hypothetical protein [Gammaproteobacteria bacterium]
MQKKRLILHILAVLICLPCVLSAESESFPIPDEKYREEIDVQDGLHLPPPDSNYFEESDIDFYEYLRLQKEQRLAEEKAKKEAAEKKQNGWLFFGRKKDNDQTEEPSDIGETPLERAIIPPTESIDSQIPQTRPEEQIMLPETPFPSAPVVETIDKLNDDRNEVDDQDVSNTESKNDQDIETTVKPIDELSEKPISQPIIVMESPFTYRFSKDVSASLLGMIGASIIGIGIGSVTGTAVNASGICDSCADVHTLILGNVGALLGATYGPYYVSQRHEIKDPYLGYGFIGAITPIILLSTVANNSLHSTLNSFDLSYIFSIPISTSFAYMTARHLQLKPLFHRERTPFRFLPIYSSKKQSLRLQIFYSF